jgi:hypothetical protein
VAVRSLQPDVHDHVSCTAVLRSLR